MKSLATFLGVFFAQFRYPPWSNQRVRWPVRWLAWGIASLGVLALTMLVFATITEGFLLSEMWFAAKMFLSVGYLTALCAFVAWHRKAPAGWVPWCDLGTEPPNNSLERSRER